MRQNGFTTTILHSDRHQSVEHGAVHKPMHPSSEFAYEDARELAAVFQGKAGFTYARQGTPTTTALEAKITRMEGGKGSVSFSTGMAALSAIFTTLLRRGDHLVSSQYVFGNTNSLLGTLLELGVEISFVDATDSAQVREAIRPNTRMVFTETIANPGTQVADLAVIGEICRERGLVYVVDNTLTSPWMFRPSSVGASLVMNSLSKYIGGHGNALGGAVTDTGLYDWSGYGNIYEAYRKGRPPAGADADQEEGPARHGRHAGGRAGAPHRGWRRDAGAAHGQALFERAGAGAFPGIAPRRSQGALSRPGEPSAARARARCSARASAACWAWSWPMAWTASIS